MQSILTDQFHTLFNSITSPIVHVTPLGEKVQATPSGEALLPKLLFLYEPLHGPTALNEQIARLLEAPCSSYIACENSVVKLTPLPKKDMGGILEWLPQPSQEKLGIFQEVSQAVNSSLILEDIFESLGDVLRKYIPYTEASIVILDDTQNGIKILVRIQEDGTLDISGENNAFAGYDPIVDRVVREPISHLFTNRQLPQSVVFSKDVTDAIVVPLINKGVVIGLIAMSSNENGGFYYYQEELLNLVSSQLAVAVENAKFYWQTQSQASREFLINQLTKSIRESLDIDTILSTAVRELGKVTGVSRCFISYYSSPNIQTHQYALPGTPPLQNWHPDFERKIFELRKDQTYNPFVLNDIRDCPRQLASPDVFEANQIKSMAIIPILIRDTLVGTVSLHQCDAYRAWVMEDIELLKGISEHLGVALHQARLFLELDEQKKTLEQTLEELQQAQLYLIQSEKMAVLGQFVAGIAHEVNTPLGTMISNNATLHGCIQKLKQSDPEHQPVLIQTMADLLDLNKLAASRIQDIVKNLRNFARLDESELKNVDIHEGIDSTLLVMQSSLKPHVRIVKEYGENIPHIQCYPGLLNQVFMNMIVNAMHAMDDPMGDPTDNQAADQAEGLKNGQLTIQTLVRDGILEVTFIDTGKGIAPEHLSKIFDPGYTTKGAGVGTGLGLALCYRIVEKHQGHIQVESTVGQGTRFTIRLPVSPRP